MWKPFCRGRCEFSPSARAPAVCCSAVRSVHGWVNLGPCVSACALGQCLGNQLLVLSAQPGHLVVSQQVPPRDQSAQVSLGNSFLFQKRHRSNDSTASGRDRSHSCDSAEALPCKVKEEPWLQEMCNAFLQQYIQYLQSMGFILVQVRPPSPTTRRSVMFWEACWRKAHTLSHALV